MFEQDRFLVRLQQYVLHESAIAVCFLAGSYGRRQEDPYSDLDVAFVFATDAQRDAAWAQRREMVNQAMPYVPPRSFDAAHVRPFFHIALYSNGSKVDYRYEVMARMQPNPWDRDLRILKDTADKWGEQYQTACAQTYHTMPRLSAAELTGLDNRFWVMFWDVFRQVLRGDHDKPFEIYIQLLHFSLPPLLQVLPPEDPARHGLQQAFFSQDTKATAKQMAQLLAAYLAARSAVVQRLNLDFVPNHSFESAIQKLVARHTVNR
jgi:hypothetical protein